MSASSKKKLRREQEAEKLTERQLTEQKEAKKLKNLTTLFVVVLAAIVVIAVVAGANQFITSKGIRENNTVAATIGDHEISNAELNYFYVDYINNFVNQYGSYISMFGLDMTKPLNEQVTNEDTGDTWADDFLFSATDNATTVYALADEAEAKGFTLSDEEVETVETNLINMRSYGMIYGYSDLDMYLKAIYGNGASEESYREYQMKNALAQAYYTAYSEGLTYDDAALREADAANPAAYSAFSYNSYYLNASAFREGGTKDENGTVTYSDAEIAAGVAAAEKAAKELIAEEIKTAGDLDKAIGALEIYADAETAPTSTNYTDVAYNSVISTIREWVTDSNRKAGDLTYIANTSTSTDEDGKETTTTNGYYVVLFNGSGNNVFPLANVRHILVSFEGGTTDSNTGVTTYSDEEKATAKAKAEELLAQWKAGEATEASFGELAIAESTDPGSASQGGLYEDVYPGQMVANFNDWCFEDSRKAGDTGIVETDYGYHVMFYVSDSETNYRDYLIATELRTNDTNEWYASLIDSMVTETLDTKYLSMDMVLQAG